jgi:arylsulfatase A-like enzyme/thioredoxin-like negative regulator of GroEL
VLVTIDTLRADHVGCYGYAAAKTPTLDGLALEGVLFDDARSHVPLTAPSHATILTGVLPPRHGVRGNGSFHLRADAPALAESLRQGGYRTAAVVASVVLDRATGLDRGFDSYDDNQRTGPRSAFNYVERGASQIEQSAEATLRGLQPPFFLWVHFYDPHVPWVAPVGTGYDAEIAFADAALGRVLAAAKARAGADLVVVVASDHGESLGEHGESQHGYTLHRGVLRVPLVIAGPGIPRGRIVTPTVGLVDVAPTLAEIARVDLKGASGRSLRRFWKGAALPTGAEDAEIWEETLHPLFDSGWAPLRGLLGRRWHLVDAPKPELYDRAADPSDRNDLARERTDTVASLTQRLHDLAASMGDVAEPETRAAATPEEKERREKLASLGYASVIVAPEPDGGRLDPKDGLPGFRAVEEAERLLDTGDAAHALALLAPFLKSDPTNARLWHTQSKAQAQAGDLDGAERSIERAQALAPPLAFLRYTHADILRRRGDVKGVTVELEAILSDNPREVDASLELAAMAFRGNDRERSKAILLASYRAGARDPALLDRLGQHMLLESAQAEANRFFSEALALWPNDPSALLAIARFELRANDAAAAIEKLVRCVAAGPHFECRMELARAYVLGPRDLPAARRELVAARDLATDHRLKTEVDQRIAAIDAMKP